VRVWITRAEPGASRTAARVRALGHQPLVAPLLTIRPLPVDPAALRDAATLAFTSANAVAAWAALTDRRALPVFTVGAATADAARAAGFADVRSADGDVDALAALLARERPSQPILHPCAAKPAGDLAAALALTGLHVLRMPIYAAADAPSLPAEAAEAERILLHSPRAARTLARLGDARLRTLPTLCLSPAVADPLLAAGFTALQIAARPDEAALLALLGARPASD